MALSTGDRLSELETQPSHLAKGDSDHATDSTKDEIIDIEHTEVVDDPRKWSAARKKITLTMIACAALIATLGANIYNPGIQQIEDQLHANDAEIALSLSLYIVVQGTAPNFWAAVTEIKGRKVVYLSSFILYIAGCAVCGAANSVALLIGMRVLQACGGAAVLTIGAGTLADIFEPKERGSMLGVYYAAPLLGPALGPILGGVLTRVWSWRATFYFLSALAGILFIAFLSFKDTFRKERSLAYQSAARKLRNRQAAKAMAAHRLSSGEDCGEVKGDERTDPTDNPDSQGKNRQSGETQQFSARPTGDEPGKLIGAAAVKEVKLSLADVNPFPQIIQITRRKNNILMYFPSGLLFALSYSISYTCSTTLFAPPYSYDALRVGLVLLSFGIGSICGSLLGGRWSDHVLSKLKKANGGSSHPEMRLESTKMAMPFLPASVLAYAWMADKHVHVSGLVIALFFVGFSSIWIYSSTLAYIVDANAGRSSNAVATNSFARGIAGFVASEIAVPLQRTAGDGGLYTIWAVLCILLDLAILFAIARGEKWRKEAEDRESAHAKARDAYERK